MNAAFGVRPDRFDDLALFVVRVVLALLVLRELFAAVVDFADFALRALPAPRALFAPPALFALFALFAPREPALFALFFAIRPPSQEGVRARRDPADVRVARHRDYAAATPRFLQE
jgi:hypothetical protein